MLLKQSEQTCHQLYRVPDDSDDDDDDDDDNEKEDEDEEEEDGNASEGDGNGDDWRWLDEDIKKDVNISCRFMNT